MSPVQRDRDDSGRPRSARPRDALGRPLPHGAEGEPRVPDDLVLPPDETLDEAQRLLDEERPFHAHEVLEARWKSCPPDERDLWQGLAQLAVGLTHIRRGNQAGARTLLARTVARIDGYRTESGLGPYGIDIAGLVQWCDSALAQATPAPPRLRG